jgi:hypothetical protein
MWERAVDTEDDAQRELSGQRPVSAAVWSGRSITAHDVPERQQPWMPNNRRGGDQYV